ncbi:unnamed protein product, partial [Prorocentrum cordatum]
MDTLKEQYDAKVEEHRVASEELDSIKLEVATARAAVMGTARPAPDGTTVSDAMGRYPHKFLDKIKLALML